MYKTISLFGNSRINEVMSATRINEYSQRDLLEVTLDLHDLWGSEYYQSIDIYLWVGFLQRRFNKLLRLNLIIYNFLSIYILIQFRQRVHIQEIELFLNTSMSPSEFLSQL